MALPAAGALLAGRYRVRRLLGRGGMGATFAVWDDALQQEVALKLLAHEPLGAALRQEFRLLTGLLHPYLGRVLDFGGALIEDRRVPYFTSQLVRGIDLAEHARASSWPELRQALCGPLWALAALHRAGLRHGDIKPANMLVSTTAAGPRGTLIDLSAAHRFGRCDKLSGTPGLLAPELLQGEAADQRADLFALGVSLTRLAEAGTPLPETVRALADRMQARDVAARPVDVAEVLDGLGIRSEPPRTWREPQRLVGRDGLLAQFEQMLAALHAGTPRPRVLVLHGPAGCGRSRLLQEMKWSAQLRGEASDGHGYMPGALLSLLGRACDRAHGGLHLFERLREGPAPAVLLLDDVQAMPDDDRAAWWRLLATVAHSDALLVACAVDVPPQGEAKWVLHPVPALTAADVQAWTAVPGAEGLSDAAAAEAVRLSGGWPGELSWLLQHAPRRACTAAELRTTAARVPQADSHDLSALAEGERALLATLAAAGTALPLSAIAEMALDEGAVAVLDAAGWLRVNARGIELRRAMLAEPILDSLPADERRDAHQRLAQHHEDTWPDALSGVGSAQTAACTRHHLRAADRAAALRVLDRAARWRLTHPDPWLRCALEIVDAPLGDDATATRLRAAAIEVLLATHHSDRVLSYVATELRAARRGSAKAWRWAGEACLRKGQHKRAQRYLERALHMLASNASNAANAANVSNETNATGTPDEVARLHDLLSRAALKLGDYQRAQTHAEQGLKQVEDDRCRADLHDDLGLAHSYLGQLDEAHEQLAAAAALHAAGAQPRAQARTASYRALLDYRNGDTLSARDGFAQALSLAEACDAIDLTLYAAQSHATACHQAGALGEALTGYRQALASARALGQTGAAIALRCNLAKLYSDIGLFERALSEAEACRNRAEDSGMKLQAATAMAIIGEVRLHQGRGQDALGALRQAEQLFGPDALREQCETALHRADAWRLSGERGTTERTLQHAAALCAELDAADVRARLQLAQARNQRAAGRSERAIPLLEAALDQARQAAQRELQAEAHALLAELCSERAAYAQAQQHTDRARAIWERNALSLPAAMVDAYWSHPWRSKAASPSALAAYATGGAPLTAHATSPAGDERAKQLQRLLDINKKLNSSLEPAQIVQWTMDAALELTGAERGFVLLSAGPDQPLEVKVARNVDPAMAGVARAFSQSIAQQVVASASPVITIDAQRDQRFESEQSVHAMKLTSVVSVPIIAPAGVIGALYLDHRFKRGIFGEDEVAVLRAFADQVAIALTNAQLHETLAERTRQLDALLAGQAAQIDVLTEQLKAQQQVLEHRYDYSNIVGRSSPMRAMFRILDRVIDSTLPVLIQGESGTGKELIAKAIHYNGPRKDKPLVTINCGAVPEALLESELFGHVRGAFTGAQQDRDGLFVTARGGTVLLDEVGEMPAAMQVKLLRVLQEREVTPVGSSKPRPIDIRLLAATNRQLRDEVAEGRFREDLYYRIGVVEVQVPPLRARLDDLPLLVKHLLDTAAARLGRPAPAVSAAAMRKLHTHRWPGNIRELDNTIAKALVLGNEALLGEDDFTLRPATDPDSGSKSRAQHQASQRDRLLGALRASDWNVSETARLLGVSRPTVYRRMKRYGLEEQT